MMRRARDGMAACVTCGGPLPRRERTQRYCSRRCFDAHRPPPPPDPTPSEIAERARAVRESWGPGETLRRLRHYWRSRTWLVPRVRVAECDLSLPGSENA